MAMYTLSLGSTQADLSSVGGKGAALAQMVVAGLPVPDGFHVTTRAYQTFVVANELAQVIQTALVQVDPDLPSTLAAAEKMIRQAFESAHMPPDVAAAIAQAYAELEGVAPVVAVRSSATAEDLPDLSFAGQQETFLNIEGLDAVLKAVKRCWASLWTARAIGYRARHQVAPERLSLAVVVQRLVPAEVAGILFTANPLNGRRDQALVNAAWGLGESIVGGGVTPDSFTIDRATATVSAEEISDKAVMTVRVDGGTEERPVPDDLRKAPCLNETQLVALVRLGEQIEVLYGAPRDVEFALADGEFAIVQARPITALPEPPIEAEAEPIKDWPLPKPKGQYMRNSIVDLMPDPLLPLYATLGLSSINRTMQMLITEVFGGPADSLPEDTLLTINGYAYMNVGYTPVQMLKLLWYMVPKFGRMLRTGVQYWQEDVYPVYAAATERWEAKDLQTLTTAELLNGIEEMSEQAARHLGALMVSTMGPSAGAEGLFTNVYEKLVRKEGEPPASALLLGFDNIPLTAEKALYDLAQWSRSQPDLAAYLSGTATEDILVSFAEEITPPIVDAASWSVWCERFREYLHDFGYAIYYLDFTRALPMDDPIPEVETLKLFMADKATSPYERQQALVERREAAVAVARGRIRGLKKRAFETTLRWAQRRVPLREDGIAEIGLGYPVLRAMSRELGSRIAAAGVIAEADDIYWMEAAEVTRSVADLERDLSPASLHEAIAVRKSTWRMQKRVTPPPVLPPKAKYMGIDVSSYTAEAGNVEGSRIIKGLGASPGSITAPACVLHGPEDFDQMETGHILVASITTPAWTPLFAMASGVVTDVGGPLSHGSIVAREYGIPAVMGTGAATRLIAHGQMITVSGDTGEVLLLNGNNGAW